MRSNSHLKKELNGSARLFAALGDETRLLLVGRLSNQGPASISRLTEGFPVTRQAITKHLQLLEASGLVCSTKHGRESLWQLDQNRLEDARRYLGVISKQWDEAFSRLRQFVDDPPDH